MDERAAIIAELITRQPGHPGGTTGFLRQVCGAATEALSASGAGVSVLTGDGVRGAAAASSPVSERIEELPFILGEGPCLDAFGARRPVMIPDLDDVRCWPFYAPTARECGLRAVFAFPLQVGSARLGVLDVFRENTGPLRGAELADALIFADVTVAALLDRQEGASGTGGVVLDDDADEYRSELFQAQGMVMVQLGVTLVEAMARIRAYAFAEDRRLSEVARHIVTRRLRFDQDG